MTRKFIGMRTSDEFKDMIEKIQKEKIRNGTAEINDRRTFSTRRITLAMTRCEEMDKIIKAIVDTKLDTDLEK